MRRKTCIRGVASWVSTTDLAAQEQHPYPTKGYRSTSAPGPGSPALDTQNPDSFLRPPSDAGGVRTFKYPCGISHKRMQEGGWSREVTVRELPVYGNACITAIDLDGKSFVADVTEGDLLVFSHRDSTLHPGTESRRRGVSAGV